jgi:hypothetical protein
MLETHKDRGEFIVDLRVAFFLPKGTPIESVNTNFRFTALNVPEKPRYLVETMSVDFDNDWNDDKPGLICKMSELSEPKHYPWHMDFLEHQAPIFEPEQTEKSKYLSNPGYIEWYYFSRVLVEVDREYEWDFEDEVAIERFDDEVKRPFYEALRIDAGDLPLSWYSIGVYDWF